MGDGGWINNDATIMASYFYKKKLNFVISIVLSDFNIRLNYCSYDSFQFSQSSFYSPKVLMLMEKQ